MQNLWRGRNMSRRKTCCLLMSALTVVAIHTGMATYMQQKREENKLPSPQERLHSWISLSSYLPEGRLTGVDVSVDVLDVKDKQQLILWVQLWSPVEQKEETRNYKLRWQKAIQITDASKMLYQVRLGDDEVVMVSGSDQLGWTSNSDRVKVSATFGESYGSVFYYFSPQEFPKLGASYLFDGLVQPYQFSLEPHVDQNFLRRSS